jgi:hypothetical protein
MRDIRESLKTKGMLDSSLGVIVAAYECDHHNSQEGTMITFLGESFSSALSSLSALCTTPSRAHSLARIKKREFQPSSDVDAEVIFNVNRSLALTR